jgi:hypothetical protein
VARADLRTSWDVRLHADLPPTPYEYNVAGMLMASEAKWLDGLHASGNQSFTKFYTLSSYSSVVNKWAAASKYEERHLG